MLNGLLPSITASYILIINRASILNNDLFIFKRFHEINGGSVEVLPVS